MGTTPLKVDIVVLQQKWVVSPLFYRRAPELSLGFTTTVSLACSLFVVGVPSRDISPPLELQDELIDTTSTQL